MSDYRLPMDVDGVKYHGTVDQNEENPGLFMYGLDENGNKRIIRTDEQGNVLTRVTGSIVELFKIENYRINSGQTKWFDDFELTTPYYRIFIYFVAEDLGQGEAIVNAPDIKQQLRIYSSILTVGSTFVVGTAKDIVVEKTNVTSSGLSSITSQKYTTKSPLSRVYINNTSDIDMDFSIQVIGFDA